MALDLRDFTKPNEWTDLTLLVEERKIYTSGYLLAAMSPVLKNTVMNEKTVDQPCEIRLDDVTYQEMDAILKWMLRLKSDVDGYLLSRVAYRLEIPGLMEECHSHLLNTWKKSQARCLTALQIAQDFNFAEMRENIIEYLSDMNDTNFKEHMKSEEFGKIDRQICVDIFMLRTTKSERKSSLHSTCVNLVVEGHVIPVSRCVLSAASPVFRAMFESGMRESNTQDIPLPGKKAEAVNFMVDYVISMGRPGGIPEGIIVDLIKLAEEYQIDMLKNDCEHQIISSLKTKKL